MNRTSTDEILSVAPKTSSSIFFTSSSGESIPPINARCQYRNKPLIDEARNSCLKCHPFSG